MKLQRTLIPETEYFRFTTFTWIKGRYEFLMAAIHESFVFHSNFGVAEVLEVNKERKFNPF